MNIKIQDVKYLESILDDSINQMIELKNHIGKIAANETHQYSKQLIFDFEDKDDG